MEPEPLIPKHGGYRKLKSFQIAQLCYDLTVRFCDRYISPRSRTHDQMVQAARSGVQNIAEGSMASGTSKKMELKLTNVARASLEELRLDYEDFLRQRSLPLWPEADPRRKALVARRCTTADAVADWVREVHGPDGQNGPDGQAKRPCRPCRPFGPPTPRSRQMPRWCSLVWPARSWTDRSKLRRRHSPRRVDSRSGCTASEPKGKSMALNESIVEAAAIEWFGEQGYAVGHGPQLAPGEQAGGTLTPTLCLRLSPLRSGSQGEREKREAIRRLNPANACGRIEGFKFQREGRRCHEEQTGA